MRFAKMHGAGNDFVVVDDADLSPPVDLPSLARRITDRRGGVGADGLIVIERARDDDAPLVDFAMRIFNRDGSEAELCGNGLRCVYRMLERSGRIEATRAVTVRTGAGVVSLDGAAREPGDVGVELPMAQAVERATIESFAVPIEDRRVRVRPVDLGNPHAVVFLGDDEALGLDDVPLDHWGPAIAALDRFPRGANVEIVRRHTATAVEQRTWERGSGETLACGSGACAVVVAGVAAGLLDARSTEGGVSVTLRGGVLRILWDGWGRPIRMEGPAVHVFDGDWLDDDAAKRG